MRDDDGVWFKFRLMGTELANRLHHDMTGKMLLDLQIGGWEEEWRKNLLAVTKMKLPVVDESRIEMEGGLSLEIEHLAMPVSEDGVNVDRIWGSIDFFSIGDKKLSEILPEIDLEKISRVDLAKRIIISNLRIQL